MPLDHTCFFTRLCYTVFLPLCQHSFTPKILLQQQLFITGLTVTGKAILTIFHTKELCIYTKTGLHQKPFAPTTFYIYQKTLQQKRLHHKVCTAETCIKHLLHQNPFCTKSVVLRQPVRRKPFNQPCTPEYTTPETCCTVPQPSSYTSNFKNFREKKVHFSKLFGKAGWKMDHLKIRMSYLKKRELYIAMFTRV